MPKKLCDNPKTLLLSKAVHVHSLRVLNDSRQQLWTQLLVCGYGFAASAQIQLYAALCTSNKHVYLSLNCLV